MRLVNKFALTVSLAALWTAQDLQPVQAAQLAWTATTAHYGEDRHAGEGRQTTTTAPLYRTHYRYTVLETLPHSRGSFTQGLIVVGDELIESSGLYGKSFLHRYPVSGGAEGRYRKLPRRLFAEGIALVNDQLFMLTWQNGQALVLNPDTFATERSFHYRGEGWGLATFAPDGAPPQLVMSNGTDQLSFRDPDNFQVLRTLTVTDQRRPLYNINDLSVAHGLIWANVWHSTEIVAIDPHSGEVVGKLDLRAQADEQPGNHPEDVLNGIAWDEQRQGFWVTGKRWDRRYLIRVEPVVENAPVTAHGGN